MEVVNETVGLPTKITFRLSHTVISYYNTNKSKSYRIMSTNTNVL